MMRHAPSITLGAVALASLGMGALSQPLPEPPHPSPSAMQDRVTDSLAHVDTGGKIFTPKRAASTAEAFDADETPPEAALDDTTINAAAAAVIADPDSFTSNVYGRVQTPPRMEIQADDSRLDPAKWASTIGTVVMGDLQNGDARSCSYSDFGSAPAFQRSCDRYQDFSEPSCAVSLNLGAGTEFTDRSACAPYKADALCIPRDLTCISGPETRIVGGVEETRLCWEWRQDYFCHAAGEISNCKPYEVNPACTEQKSDCLAYNGAGECSHSSVLFECGNPEIRPPQECRAIEICEGSLCEGIPNEPDEDLAEAAAWLNVANEAAGDNLVLDASCDLGVVTASGECAGGEIRFFEGRRQTCGRAPLGLRNCCSNSGILVSLFDDCSDEELDIQAGLARNETVYLGEYCSRRFFGVCRRRSLAYCNYNSKFARVFQEEIRRVSAIDWDSPRREECAGLSAAEMASVDFERIDLSELFDDMLAEVGLEDPAEVNRRILERMTLFDADPSGVLKAPGVDENFNNNKITVTPALGGEGYSVEEVETPERPVPSYAGTSTDDAAGLPIDLSGTSPEPYDPDAPSPINAPVEGEVE